MKSVQAAIGAAAIPFDEGGRVELDELDELAEGDVAELCGAARVVVHVDGDVEGLGEEGGEVRVGGVAADGVAAAAGFPEAGAERAVEKGKAANDGDGAAEVGGEFQAEAEECDAGVLSLAAAFTCGGVDA